MIRCTFIGQMIGCISPAVKFYKSRPMGRTRPSQTGIELKRNGGCLARCKEHDVSSTQYKEIDEETFIITSVMES